MRVGIIGCGKASREHLRTLCRMREVEVVAACDVDEAKAGAAAPRRHAYGP